MRGKGELDIGFCHPNTNKQSILHLFIRKFKSISLFYKLYLTFAPSEAIKSRRLGFL